MISGDWVRVGSDIGRRTKCTLVTSLPMSTPCKASTYNSKPEIGVSRCPYEGYAVSPRSRVL